MHAYNSNIDDNWMEPTRDTAGNLQVRKDKFPRGIKFLADYAHTKGMKLGIYSAHGSRTCMGNAASGTVCTLACLVCRPIVSVRSLSLVSVTPPPPPPPIHTHINAHID